MKEAHNWLGEQSFFIARGRGGGGGVEDFGGQPKTFDLEDMSVVILYQYAIPT